MVNREDLVRLVQDAIELNQSFVDNEFESVDEYRSKIDEKIDRCMIKISEA